ncbi:SusE domain-containing protein [Flavobacterium granuli]|uniref:SusE outer membrane protein domain-containing protein n=1 Tax=Flavobacterium granuli TaxID=280093 RepID=A0ABU1S7B3_9FLAO|nr:SusE domain-containing protein [Flavobacterium granuli]MDR6846807.1 hypothetical protein [Flavobacterium granuli]
MKNITKSLIGLFAVFAFSCTPSDIQDRPEVTTTDVPVLTAPQSGAIYELKGENAELQAERFTWNSANFGGATVTYTLEIDTKVNNFTGTTEFKNLGSVEAQNQLSVSVTTMDEAALALGAVPYSPTEFVVRIKAVAGTAPVMYSDAIGIVINPYINPARLWLPGGYQGASGYGGDWTPATAPQLASSGLNKPDLEGYVNFASVSAFKMTVDATWDKPQFGLGDTAGTIKLNGGDIPTPASTGYYLVEVNAAKLSYKFTKTDWGIVGDATGSWDNSTNMTYNATTKVWTITAALTVGSMKFRANNGWDINYGDTGADGTLEFNVNDNIPVAVAGNYIITLDLSNPRAYTYTMVLQP